MAKYAIMIEKKGQNCKKGTCGHVHEIEVELPKSKHIVCSNLDCKEVETSNVKHILVAYDGSSYSNHAFELALDLAKKYEAVVTVGSVINSSNSNNSFLDLPNSDETVDHEKLAIIERSFARLASLSKKFMVPIKTETFVSSSIVDALLSYANAHKADMIVMGTRGKGENIMLVGSISVGVSTRATCPVILVK